MRIKMILSLILITAVIGSSALIYSNNKNTNVAENKISENNKLVEKKQEEIKKEEIKEDKVKDVKPIEKEKVKEEKVEVLKKDSNQDKVKKAVNDGKIKTNVVKSEKVKKEEVKEIKEEKIEIINFNTYRKENSSMKKGSEKVVQKGENGSKKITYKYLVVDGQKKLKDKNELITKKAIDQIVEIGTLEIVESKGYYDRNQAVQTLEIVNAYRKTHGKSSLTWNSSLESGTNIRAKELKSNFSHTRPNGQSWKSVSSIAMAENVAYGYSSPQRVIDGFMNSDGHRKNILNDRWSSVAMSLYIEDGVYYWAQLFAE